MVAQIVGTARPAMTSDAGWLGDRFSQLFGDERACLEFLWRARFSADGEHALCPRCRDVRRFRFYTTGEMRRSWTCTACGLHLHPTAGTILEKTRTPLRLWFRAAYLISGPTEAPVDRLRHELGLSRETARRIRRALTATATRSGSVLSPWGGHGQLVAMVAAHVNEAQPRNHGDPAPPTGADLGNLPIHLTPFVGRLAEITMVRRVLARSRLVTLVGPGGCGKTRLALEIARALVDQTGDGVWWVDLTAVAAANPVSGVIADALGVRVPPGHQRLAVLCQHLRKRGTVLVLDNCEHVLDECAAVLRPVLAAAPDLRVLATSRMPVGVAGETVWRVPPLGTPTVTACADADALLEFDAVRLFVERAGAAHPAFQLDAGNAGTVAQICLRLDGVPLAIELAAAKTGVLSPAQIAGALGEMLDVTTGAARSSPARQQTLRASLDWSYALLDESDRALIRRLGVFGGSFSLAAVQHVCADRFARGTAMAHLFRLVDASMVTVEERVPAYRYRLHETVRRYALERLDEAGETHMVRDRHLAHALTLVADVAPQLVSERQAEWLKALELDLPDLRAALDWAIAEARGEEAAQIVNGLVHFFFVRLRLSEGRAWFADALACGDGRPSAERARALWGAAHLAFAAGDLADARERGTAALAMARAVGDRRTIGRVLQAIGGAQVHISPAHARSTLEESAQIARELGDDWCLTVVLGLIAMSWTTQCALDSARRALVAAERARRQPMGPNEVAWQWLAHAIVSTRAGDLAAASEAAASAGRLAAEADAPGCGGWAMLAEAEIACWRASRNTLIAVLGRVQAQLAALPDLPWPLNAAPLNAAAGKLAYALGDLATAARHLDRGAWFAAEVAWHWVDGLCRAGLADIALAHDDPERAAYFAHGVADCARRLDNNWMTALAKHRLAQSRLYAGDGDRAAALCGEALALLRDGGYRPDAVHALETLADVYISGDAHLAAARLLGAAVAARRRLGIGWMPVERARQRERVSAVTRALGAAGWRDARDAGCRLSLDEALTLVTRGRGRRRRSEHGWDSLTPTEKIVARLVAEGCTNREIAGRMFVSPSTVKAHLAHVFAKVGVAHRSELATEATRRSI